MNQSEVSLPSVNNILCVLSQKQAEDFEPDLRLLRGPNVEVVMASSAEEGLSLVGDVNPPLVIAGMDLGEMEGLEFLALLMSRYPEFYSKVVVLPERTDPFPPVLQYRDRATGRSVTEQTDWKTVVNLARSLAAAPGPAAALKAVPAARQPKVLAVEAKSIDEWGDALQASLRPPGGTSEAVSVQFVSSDPAPAPASATPAAAPGAGRKRVGWIVAAAGALLGVVALALLLRTGSSETAAPPDVTPGTMDAPPPQAQATAAVPTSDAPGNQAAPAAAAPAQDGPANQAAPAPAAAPPSPEPSKPEPERDPAEASAMQALRDGVALPLRFDKGRAVFSVTNQEELDRVLEACAAALAANPRARIQVGGHTSDEGEESKNQLLGRRRATEVWRYLIGRGLAGRRLIVKSYGESSALTHDERPPSRSSLRRVTLKLR